MALWTGLGQAATVAQLVGADIGGLISMCMQAALTARQNKECEQLARRVFLIAQLLPQVQDREAARQLAGLGDTLRDSHELVLSCQGRSTAYQVFMSGRQAERFKEVQSNIDFYLMLFPVISHIDVTCRLDRIYKVLVPDDSTKGEPSPLPQSSQLQESTEVVREVLPHGTQEFTFPELEAATNNFDLDNMIGRGGAAIVYWGRLHDGREVAVKRFKNFELDFLEGFHRELDILSRLQHKHIIPFVGLCVSNDKRLLATSQKKKKGLLTWWKKVREEPEMEERMIVYEYMENGALFDHLHSDQYSDQDSSLSSVTVSWKMRIDVLLGVSRAIEHLHCHAKPRVIHRDVKSLNILLDANLVPRLSDFNLSVALQTGCDEFDTDRIMGTPGYLDPLYAQTCLLEPANDVYSLGVVMLEVLTGKKAFWREEGQGPIDLASFALPIIDAGNFGELLDRRPVPEPTPRQLQLLEFLARTAVCCVRLVFKGRPAISDIVANLESVHQLFCIDELSSC